jgi:hypothetical protein
VRLEQIVSQVIDSGKKAYVYNERVSSELYNQPKPVDSIVDDFAVEAQNFANALTMSAAFASGVLAFRLVGDGAADLASSLLAVVNIVIAFGTMTNAARYKIRNEEARVMFADEKLLCVKKSVFDVMDRESQGNVPLEQNPFVTDIESQVNLFLATVDYYNGPEPKEFKRAYLRLKNNFNDPLVTREFQHLLTTKFIVDTYHVNSYLQEYLVNIYAALDEMYAMLTIESNIEDGKPAERLFRRLVTFEPRLERTLQRGATRFGFVKQRKFSQWDIVVVFKFLWSLLSCASSNRSTWGVPISTETLGIVRQTKRLASKKSLHRETRDLETLYWATRESDIGSLIFVSAFLVFVASLVFSIARAFEIQVLEEWAFWGVATAALVAMLATLHLWRKLWILLRLLVTLFSKMVKLNSPENRTNILKVTAITATQVLLTVMRLLSAGAASVALPWSVAGNGYGDRISSDEFLAFWIALGAVGMAVASTVFFFVVEFVVRYNLSPRLGEFVCETFRDEIEDLYCVMAPRRWNKVDTKQVQERETWEYVAREFLHKYRFDAVFAADRFGSILQYLQSACEKHRSVRFHDEEGEEED